MGVVRAGSGPSARHPADSRGPAGALDVEVDVEVADPASFVVPDGLEPADGFVVPDGLEPADAFVAPEDVEVPDEPVAEGAGVAEQASEAPAAATATAAVIR